MKPNTEYNEIIMAETNRDINSSLEFMQATEEELEQMREEAEAIINAEFDALYANLKLQQEKEEEDRAWDQARLKELLDNPDIPPF